MRFYTIPPLFRYGFPNVLFRFPPKAQKCIYLTFDDGPQPKNTYRILAMLETFNAKATFFCVGENVVRYPEIFQLLTEKGHLTANHTHQHLNGWKTKTTDYLENVAKAAPFFSNKLFRPPYGKITWSQYRRLSQLGYQVVLWDVLSYDFDAGIDLAKTAQIIKKHTQDGSIIVFHDHPKAQPQLEILLPDFLQFWHQKGYAFEVLPFSKA